MEPKDFITLAISLAAFVLSLVATIFSLSNKKHEDERSLRSLMNVTIGNIRSSRIDQAKYRNEHYGKGQNVELVLNVLSLYNYQINSLTRLAVYVAEKIPTLVTDIEFATLADAFAWTGDRQKGKQYWEAAIAASKDRYYEIINRRDFANFLFLNGNVGEGRDQYKKALDLSPISDDVSKYQTGYTYRMWGWNERAAGNELSARDYFDRAAEAFRTISVEGVRASALADLDQVRNTPPTAVPQPMPGEPAAELMKTNRATNP